MLLAKKKNMTQAFDEQGNVIAVTVLDYSECSLINGQKKSGKFVGLGKKNKPSKAELGKYGELVPEFSVLVNEDSELLVPEVGSVLNVTGTSKGKGFAGVVKMWNFKGGRKTHGQSDRHRAPGSIGAGTTMGRVIPGLKMARRKGSERVQIRGVKVIALDTENKLISVAGSIPGSYNSIVEIVEKK